MTDEELKELVGSLAVSQKETDRQLKETDEQIKKLSISQKETYMQLKETDRKLDKVANMISGIGTNQGDVAEDFFITVLLKIII
ncbi:hypothetical protein QUF74_16560 [Candidatus Halobeggiatoa sp. HSG11]|nr:hypothetical protein [Candidatus Halobeggiatoa sp. HSG11]